MLLSRSLGFLRQVAINAQFGVGPEADAWFAAFRIPDTIFMLLAGGALLSAVIPVYAEVRRRGDPQALTDLVTGVASLVGLGVALAAGVGALLAGPLMRLIAPGFPESTLALATDASRWLMLSPLLLGLSAVAKAVLQAQRRFWLPALSPILYNVGIIFGALVLARSFGLAGLVWGTLIGAALHLAVQLPGLRRGHSAPTGRGTEGEDPQHREPAATPSPHPSPFGRGTEGEGPNHDEHTTTVWPPGRGRSLAARLGLANPDVRKVIRLMLPRLLGVAVLQISLIYVTILASLQGQSAVAALHNAFILMLLPLGVFAMSLGEASLPDLADRWARGDTAGFAARISGLSRYVLFLTLPAAVGLAVLAEPIVAVLFQRGAFDARATELTAIGLQFFAIGLVGHAAVEVLVRGFFAMQDTRTPVAIGVASLVLHMLLSWFFAQWFGLGGIALGVSLGVLVEAPVLALALHRRGGLTATASDLRSLAITLVATVIMGLLTAVLLLNTWTGGLVTAGSAVLLLGYLAAALASYGLTAALLGSHELAELTARAFGRPRRGRSR
jgi:putative peptidoglycan lipid II flippase